MLLIYKSLWQTSMTCKGLNKKHVFNLNSYLAIHLQSNRQNKCNSGQTPNIALFFKLKVIDIIRDYSLYNCHLSTRQRLCTAAPSLFKINFKVFRKSRSLHCDRTCPHYPAWSWRLFSLVERIAHLYLLCILCFTQLINYSERPSHSNMYLAVELALK